MMTKVYEVSNPYWLADTFIFSKKHFETVFWGEIDLICYIKVNLYNKIEEIGCDFEKRFRFDFEKYNNVLARKDVSEASRKHKMRFDAIGNEYWLSLYNRIAKENSVNCTTIVPSSVDPFNQLTFDVNFPGFVKEACENCNGGIYDIAWNILNNLIGQVAQRATELHDPVLDALMIKLNLYELPNEERRKMILKLQQIYTERVSK
jgi:hypothetical protein